MNRVDPLEDPVTATAFYDVVKRYVTVGPETRVLDFGTGRGRIARCIVADTPHVTGIDPNGVSIERARATLPNVPFHVSERWPPAPVDGPFDLITAYSVFSHLPEAMAAAWIAELARLTADGGMVIVTTLGPDFLEGVRRFGGELADWQLAARLAFPDVDAALAAHHAGAYGFGPHPRPDYGMAIVPELVVRRDWLADFDLVDFLPEGPVPQAIIVLRRQARS